MSTCLGRSSDSLGKTPYGAGQKRRKWPNRKAIFAELFFRLDEDDSLVQSSLGLGTPHPKTEKQLTSVYPRGLHWSSCQIHGTKLWGSQPVKICWWNFSQHLGLSKFGKFGNNRVTRVETWNSQVEDSTPKIPKIRSHGTGLRYYYTQEMRNNIRLANVQHCWIRFLKGIPSWELTGHPLPSGTFEDDLPFPKVGSVGSFQLHHLKNPHLFLGFVSLFSPEIHPKTPKNRWTSLLLSNH